jgi:hypothetical protein
MNIEEVKARWEKQYRRPDQEFGVVLDLDAVWQDISALLAYVEKLERVTEAVREVDVRIGSYPTLVNLRAELRELEADDE